MTVPAQPTPDGGGDAAALVAAARAEHVREERLVAFSRHVDLTGLPRNAAGAIEPAALGQAVARAALEVPEFVTQVPEKRRAPDYQVMGGASMGAVPGASRAGDAEVAATLARMQKLAGIYVPEAQG